MQKKGGAFIWFSFWGDLCKKENIVHSSLFFLRGEGGIVCAKSGIFLGLFFELSAQLFGSSW